MKFQNIKGKETIKKADSEKNKTEHLEIKTVIIKL